MPTRLAISIDKFFSNKNNMLYKKELGEFLLQAISDSIQIDDREIEIKGTKRKIKGLKKGVQCSNSGYYFKFIYDNSGVRKYITYNDKDKEEFLVAVHELFIELMNKITCRHVGTINVLRKDNQVEITKWIRSTLALVLVNYVFKLNKIKEDSIDQQSNDENKESTGPKKPDVEINTDFESAIDISNQYTEDINLQKKALFWIPGKLFLDKQLEARAKALYIAFFYTWLRRCSNASFTKIAKEIGVSIQNLNREWKPCAELEQPFLEKKAICNVAFSENSIKKLGMKDTDIRCFRKKNDKKKYLQVRNIKICLWIIYNFLRNKALLNAIEENWSYLTNDDFLEMNLPFDFDFGLKAPNKPHKQIKIKSIYTITIDCEKAEDYYNLTKEDLLELELSSENDKFILNL